MLIPKIIFHGPDCIQLFDMTLGEHIDYDHQILTLKWDTLPTRHLTYPFDVYIVFADRVYTFYGCLLQTYDWDGIHYEEKYLYKQTEVSNHVSHMMPLINLLMYGDQEEPFNDIKT